MQLQSIGMNFNPFCLRAISLNSIDSYEHQLVWMGINQMLRKTCEVISNEYSEGIQVFSDAMTNQMGLVELIIS